MVVEVIKEVANGHFRRGIPRGIAMPRLTRWLLDWVSSPTGQSFDFVMGTRIDVPGILTKSPVKPTFSVGTKPLAWLERATKDVLNEPPRLAIYVPVGSMTYGVLWDQIESCHAIGIPLVWIVGPSLGTIEAHPLGGTPDIFSGDQIVTAEPHMPGFSAPAKAFFAIV